MSIMLSEWVSERMRRCHGDGLQSPSSHYITESRISSTHFYVHFSVKEYSALEWICCFVRNRESFRVFDECVLFPFFPITTSHPSFCFSVCVCPAMSSICAYTHHKRISHMGWEFFHRIFSPRFWMPLVVVVIFYFFALLAGHSFAHFIVPFYIFYTISIYVHIAPRGNEDRRTNPAQSQTPVDVPIHFLLHFFIPLSSHTLCCCSSSIILTAESSIVTINAVAVDVAVAPFLREIIFFLLAAIAEKKLTKYFFPVHSVVSVWFALVPLNYATEWLLVLVSTKFPNKMFVRMCRRERCCFSSSRIYTFLHCIWKFLHWGNGLSVHENVIYVKSDFCLCIKLDICFLHSSL